MGEEVTQARAIFQEPDVFQSRFLYPYRQLEDFSKNPGRLY